MKVRVDEDKCCGFAACLSVAPKVFDIDSDQIAVLLIDGEIPEDLRGCTRDAAEACPTDAIVIEE
ncbi:ferredoxin [Amycolatopsis acidicola]|uniref:Ferredoxin n=1 Tax=Amycolatopsis acidicola TaxID=2596893 RepID=A0A5N0VIF7_9PSEU|nr:ferredoxin [Amycolatopsis acidicola]KAA9166036.1 ferredoxin [Amycolatopsis acidicola]